MKYVTCYLLLLLPLGFWGDSKAYASESERNQIVSQIQTESVAKSHKQIQRACNLSFGWTDWPPFLEKSPHFPEVPQGLQIELVKWIAAEMDCQIQYRKLSWPDSIKAIESGAVDFVGRASKFAAREKFAFFSEPYREDLLVLTIRRGEAQRYQLTSIEKMFQKGFRLGVLKNGYLGKEIEQFRNNVTYSKNFVEFDLESEILNRLSQGEIDGIFEAPFTVDYAVMNNPVYAQFEEYPLEILVGKLQFMFSKQSISENFVAQFNQALQRVKQSKQYQEHWYWSSVK